MPTESVSLIKTKTYHQTGHRVIPATKWHHLDLRKRRHSR